MSSIASFYLLDRSAVPGLVDLLHRLIGALKDSEVLVIEIG